VKLRASDELLVGSQRLQPFTLSIGSNDDGIFLRAVGKRAQCRDEAPQRKCNATRETRFNVDVDSDLQDFLTGCTRAQRRCVFKYASWRNGNTAYWGRRTEFKRLRRKKGSYHCSWRPPLSISSRIGKPFVFCARFSRTTTREPFGYHACTRERRSLPSAARRCSGFHIEQGVASDSSDEERFGSKN
jgi:hypothetical protein